MTIESLIVSLALLFGEGVRLSGLSSQVIKEIRPQRKITASKYQSRMLPSNAFIPIFLNNTPEGVIFVPIIKRWVSLVHLSATKLLMPLSYMTIWSGLWLTGTPINMLVHGMKIEVGFNGVGRCCALRHCTPEQNWPFTH